MAALTDRTKKRKRAEEHVTRSLAKEGKRKPVVEVATFVFLELEATGLLTEQGDRTKITELCFYAVRREDLRLRSPYPRVISELKLCFNPTEEISSVAEGLSGLSNDMLKNEPKFGKKTVSALNIFLKQLPSPICLVAHNGNRFDYPLLQAEIRKTGKSLLSGVYCADSLDVYEEMHPLFPSHKLKDVYSSLEGSQATSERQHCAEGKCEMNVKCARKTEQFADWVDENKILFTAIRPYY